MTLSRNIQTLLNGTIESIKAVISYNLSHTPPSLLSQPYDVREMAVLIGIVGDMKARIIIDASSNYFSSVGAAMFGMPLEGEMLESFTGELGNMIAGNLCTVVAQQGLEIDITPPTVIVGESKLYGFHHAFLLPVDVTDIGSMKIVLSVDVD
ncbi:MAG: chemotaxis protein CheX [Psychrobacillus sp.]